MVDAIHSLGKCVDSLFFVPNEAALALLLDRLGEPERPTVLAFVNAHAAILAGDEPEFFRDLCSADLLLRDGCGMAMLLRLLGIDPGLNLNGTDLIPVIIERFRGRRIALMGTCEPWLSKSAGLLKRVGSLVITLDGFKADDEYLTALRAVPAELVILAMGMPKQERIAALLRDSLEVPCLIICGGAILDFISGRVIRAPKWVRVVGLEWLYRLFQEPRRLYYRYVIGNAIFLWRAYRLMRARRH